MKAPVQREASLGIIKRYLDIRGSSTIMTVELKGCAECEIDCCFLAVLLRAPAGVRLHNSTIKMPTSPAASPIQLQWTRIPTSNWDRGCTVACDMLRGAGRDVRLEIQSVNEK
ncbi:unnamed protein product [Danaus chrysippus]|uniref:(African queen) hypothetical protein n=1 Tax=Danaus chrysippus TaxID=151541 RepID=A0A8J2QIT1_9NEOP|nr:unnamed protein product [Danaus chrysippus]